MTPAARVSAAIEVLDQILAGLATEQALTRWARGSRFAGSKDRAAVRDLVYDAQRCRRSAFARAGGATGRDWMRGMLQGQGVNLSTYFIDAPHAPAPLVDAETVFHPIIDHSVSHDIPEWLWPMWVQDLGDMAEPTALALRDRAPTFLRVNTLKTTRARAIALLAEDGIEAVAHDSVPTALRIMGRVGAIAQSQAYQQGWVELQDASSQASMLLLPDGAQGPVLDFCAGGGGKSLALAARLGAEIHAHDAYPERMRDIPERAKRAGARVRIFDQKAALNNRYKTIFCDVPCSGSGTWRRDPEGKWTLSQARLTELVAIQAGILETVRPMVEKSGVLIYATCSVLNCENLGQLENFCAKHPEWSVQDHKQYLPSDLGDGFFVARLTQNNL